MISIHASIAVLLLVCVTTIYAAGDSKCLLPMTPGSCSGRMSYYFLNTTSGQCDLGDFSSCPGNNNYFRYKSVCERVCAKYIGKNQNGNSRDEICSQPMVEGDCTGNYVAYSYVASSGGCIRYYYSGCDGNANRFKDFATCNGVCKLKTLPVPDYPYNPQTRPHCLLPKVTGTCAGNFPSFFFDPSSSSCKHFTYTGCYGNSNRFSTMDRCLQDCWPNLAPKPAPIDRCALPKNIGVTCHVNPSQKFYYDTAEKKCGRFAYQGCGGNWNRFNSFADCWNRCKPKFTWGKK